MLAGRLQALGISSVQDLLFHLPLRYQDRTRVSPIAELSAGRDPDFDARHIANPFDGKEIHYEASPGNFTLEVEEGRVRAYTRYGARGEPVRFAPDGKGSAP